MNKRAWEENENQMEKANRNSAKFSLLDDSQFYKNIIFSFNLKYLIKTQGYYRKKAY